MSVEVSATNEESKFGTTGALVKEAYPKATHGFLPCAALLVQHPPERDQRLFGHYESEPPRSLEYSS